MFPRKRKSDILTLWEACEGLLKKNQTLSSKLYLILSITLGGTTFPSLTFLFFSAVWIPWDQGLFLFSRDFELILLSCRSLEYEVVDLFLPMEKVNCPPVHRKERIWLRIKLSSYLCKAIDRWGWKDCDQVGWVGGNTLQLLPGLGDGIRPVIGIQGLLFPYKRLKLQFFFLRYFRAFRDGLASFLYSWNVEYWTVEKV